MAKRPVNVLFEPGLLAAIDADRGAKGQTRAEWIARAARAALADPESTTRPGQATADALAAHQFIGGPAARVPNRRRDATPIPKRGTRT